MGRRFKDSKHHHVTTTRNRGSKLGLSQSSVEERGVITVTSIHDTGQREKKEKPRTRERHENTPKMPGMAFW
jgi:hypothetical protein